MKTEDLITMLATGAGAVEAPAAAQRYALARPFAGSSRSRACALAADVLGQSRICRLCCRRESICCAPPVAARCEY